jgi:DNA-binding NtrC family response regulator
LYFRLSVLPIVLPPLRERGEDLPHLVEYFLRRAASQAGRPVLRVDDRAMKLLSEYHWPGNVRELENLCERATVLVMDGILTADMMRPWLGGIEKSEALGMQLRAGHLLEDMERHLVLKTLRECQGHRARTATKLGIGVRTLGLKLKQWRQQDAAAVMEACGESRKLSA